MIELYTNGILTISKTEDNVLHYKFDIPKSLTRPAYIRSFFLQYFAVEIMCYSKEAIIDLITMAYELCNDKISNQEEKFLFSLKDRNIKQLQVLFWDLILAGDGHGKINT